MRRKGHGRVLTLWGKRKKMKKVESIRSDTSNIPGGKANPHYIYIYRGGSRHMVGGTF
jgi:hypothetical protein